MAKLNSYKEDHLVLKAENIYYVTFERSLPTPGIENLKDTHPSNFS